VISLSHSSNGLGLPDGSAAGVGMGAISGVFRERHETERRFVVPGAFNAGWIAAWLISGRL
jgi:hypothetical protein